MARLMMLKGLPASGKTTFAKQLVNGELFAYKNNWVRVNKDDMRSMLHNGKWSKNREKDILKLRDYIIDEALFDGKNVVVDDTNFAPKHQERLAALAKKHGATFEVRFIPASLDVCIERDLKRQNSVGEKVIRDMYNQYLKQKPETIEYVHGKPEAIICDIDGTIAHMGDRSPYDWGRVGEDAPDLPVIGLVDILSRNYEVILVSGRDASCEKETRDWLKKWAVDYTHLFMRTAGDKRKDTEVKREIFDVHIRGGHNVVFVLDDRNQVVEMWRQMGLKALQVADGDF